MSDLIMRKQITLFYKMDFDRDGRVERTDFTDAASQIAADLGLGDSTAVTNAFDQIWASYWGIADADGDNAISLMEWLGAQQAAFAADPAGFRARHEATIAAVVDAMGGGGDGVVTQREFRAWTRALGTSTDAADAAFEQLDSDGDGSVTREQMIDLLWDYHSSADPQSPGNWAYGGF